MNGLPKGMGYPPEGCHLVTTIPGTELFGAKEIWRNNETGRRFELDVDSGSRQYLFDEIEEDDGA